MISTERQYRSGMGTMHTSREGFGLVETKDFTTQLISDISNATSRMWIETMAFQYESDIKDVMHQLTSAKTRGVNVKFVYDAFSDYWVDGALNKSPLQSFSHRRYQRFLNKERKRVVNLLDSSGDTVRKTNEPKGLTRFSPFPAFFGTQHKKIAIIDDKAYFGGINLCGYDLQRHDFTITTDNPQIVTALAGELLDDFHGTSKKNHTIPIDDSNSILIDGIHNKGQSLIMQTLYEKIKSEKESIFLATQYPPRGKLLHALNTAVKRGVPVTVVTREVTRWEKAKALGLSLRELSLPKKHTYRLIEDDSMHARAALFGDKEIMVGSHCFNDFLARSRVREVMLLSKDPQLITIVKKYFTDLFQDPHGSFLLDLPDEYLR